MQLKKTIEALDAGTPLRLVALGDSLTEGWMVSRGYLDFLEEMIAGKYPRARLAVVNRGIPGDTAEGGLHRLRRDVIDEDPDLVFVQFALNDLFMGFSAERFQNTLRAIVSHLQNDTEADLLLVTSVPVIGDDRIARMADGFYERMAAVADEAGIAIARVHRYWKRKIEEGHSLRDLVQADGLHPTVAGYRLMAEAIMEVL